MCVVFIIHNEIILELPHNGVVPVAIQFSSCKVTAYFASNYFQVKQDFHWGKKLGLPRPKIFLVE